MIDVAAIETLRTRVAKLDREVQRREDYLAVTRLQRAYGYYLDKGYWREAADLFTDDATFEQGVDGVYVGRERIFEVIVRLSGGNIGPGLPFGQLNERMSLQGVITVAPDGLSAEGRWHELALYGRYGKDAHWGDGVYENRYRKENGVWKIAALRFYPQFVAPYEGGWAALQPLANEAEWRSTALRDFPPDHPPTATYKPFPDVYVPPFHYEHPVTGYAHSVTHPRHTTAVATAEAGIDPREAHLADIESRTARLASHEAIERLQRAYGYYADKGLWREAADLFSDDGTWEWGQSGVYQGRERIRAALATLQGPEGLAPGVLNNHYICQPIVTVAPDNTTAKARWRADLQFCRDGTASWGEGTFENTYVNEGGVWKIASLHFYVTVLWDYDKGWVSGNLPMAGPSTVLPPDAPPTEVYESLPGVYLPKYHYPNPVTGKQPERSALPALEADADGIAAEIEALATRVERIEDLRACEKLQRAYGYYVDKSMWDDVADLFGPESTLEIGGRGVFLGKQRVLEYMGVGLGPTGPQPGQIINHQQFQGIVTVDPQGERARGRWRAFVIGGSPWAPVNWGSALYENHYRKVNGVWLIDKLRAPFTMYTLYKDGWHKAATPNTRPESFPPPPDLPPSVVYLTYPNYYCEPFHYPNPVTHQAAPPPHPAAGGVAPLAPLSKAKA